MLYYNKLYHIMLYHITCYYSVVDPLRLLAGAHDVEVQSDPLQLRCLWPDVVLPHPGLHLYLYLYTSIIYTSIHLYLYTSLPIPIPVPIPIPIPVGFRTGPMFLGLPGCLISSGPLGLLKHKTQTHNSQTLTSYKHN